jgi:carbon-monoxide dehydrogenase medium subunit
LTAVGPTNLRASAAEQALAGRALDDAAIEEASRLAGEAAQPHDDTRGSAEYKRSVIRVLTVRALRKAREEEA